MSKGIDKFRAKLGDNIRQSVGADSPVPEVAVDDTNQVDKDAGSKRLIGARMIPVDKIVRDPDQPRKHFDEEKHREAVASMKEFGVLNPIRVRWDEPQARFVIIYGERRYRAAVEAGLSHIPAIEMVADAESIRLIQIIENCIRVDFNDIERADAFQNLLDSNNYTHEYAAARVGVSQGQFTKTVMLRKLSDEDKARLISGKLSFTKAYQIASRIDKPKVTRVKRTTRFDRKFMLGEVAANLTLIADKADLSEDDLVDLLSAYVERSRQGEVNQPVVNAA